jgi:hypothetical protein
MPFGLSVSHFYLEPKKCHLSKMITKYIVLHESDQLLMALRPYQFYAVEAIVNRVVNTQKKRLYLAHNRIRKDAHILQGSADPHAKPTRS